MNEPRSFVENHYGRGRILDSILAGLQALGKDIDRLEPADLAPVDEFHVRGREATVELARRSPPTPNSRVLDVGCGLGGSARYLAENFGCHVSGIDLTHEYVMTAQALTERVGLTNRLAFHCASALELPFSAGIFDLAWTEHVQMNVADKTRFYGEIARVLRPGARLLFHDIFEGSNRPVRFPVPWASDDSISFLVPPESARETLQEVGMNVVDWEDRSARTLEWFTAIVQKLKQSGPPPLGLHLLMGDQALAKFENIIRNLSEERIVVVQAVAEKSLHSQHS